MVRDIKYILLLAILFLTGCDDNIFSNNEDTFIPLELYMDRDIDEDGNYIVYFNTFNYTDIFYQTEPMTRVFWDSPNTFTIYHMGIAITEPIICCSTYSDSDDGSGKQMIYINEDFISDEVYTIFGCVGDNCQSLNFKVQ
tara:strand:- start:350 stop:769 length:420 start_codon:yes stop_codon:yes gene_type:complete